MGKVIKNETFPQHGLSLTSASDVSLESFSIFFLMASMAVAGFKKRNPSILINVKFNYKVPDQYANISNPFQPMFCFSKLWHSWQCLSCRKEIHKLSKGSSKAFPKFQCRDSTQSNALAMELVKTYSSVLGIQNGFLSGCWRTECSNFIKN